LAYKVHVWGVASPTDNLLENIPDQQALGWR